MAIFSLSLYLCLSLSLVSSLFVDRDEQDFPALSVICLLVEVSYFLLLIFSYISEVFLNPGASITGFYCNI